jgi:hypothetical protein
LFSSSDPKRQCAGVVDTNGICCVGPIDRVTGLCCGANHTVSASGRCCAGVLDACGVCGGSGIAVDVTGQCCASPLSPAGRCCGPAGADSCGVCGGLNECAAVVSVQISDHGGAVVCVAVLQCFLAVSVCSVETISVSFLLDLLYIVGC